MSKKKEKPQNAKIDQDIIDMDALLFGDEVENPDDLPEIKQGLAKRTAIEKRPEPKKRKEEKPRINVEEELGYDELSAEEYTPRRVANKPANKDKVRDIEEDLEDVSERLDKTSYLYNEENNFEKAMLKNKATGECFTIKSFPFTIGKLPNNNLVIQDKVVSRSHAEIRKEGDKYFIRDTESLNGTFVNGYKIPPNTEVELKNGQEILFANKKFSFHDR